MLGLSNVKKIDFLRIVLRKLWAKQIEVQYWIFHQKIKKSRNWSQFLVFRNVIVWSTTQRDLIYLDSLIFQIFKILLFRAYIFQNS